MRILLTLLALAVWARFAWREAACEDGTAVTLFRSAALLGALILIWR